MSRLIIVNRMYAGEYFNQGENIGGEVINLLRDENGDNYIWLNPHGVSNPEFLDYYDEIYVILVKRYMPWKWQIVGVSKIDKEASKNITKSRYGKTAHDDQLKLAKKILYGGQPHSKIMKDNVLKGEKTYPTALFFTFKSETIWVPVVRNSAELEKTLFRVSRDDKPEGIDGAENSNAKYRKGLTPRALCMYIHDKEGLEKYRSSEKDFAVNRKEYESTYTYLNDIIKSCCHEENDTFQIQWNELPADEKVNKYKDSLSTDIFEEYFLDVIGDADRELTFSNLLAYFLRNKDILKEFVKNFLGIADFDSASATIHREESNIDLLISSKSHQIIIENKIKSDLILKTKGVTTKLDEYFSNSSDVQKDAKSNLKKRFFVDGQERAHYQIDRYFAYAVSKAISYGAENYDSACEKIKGFIIAPNYHYTVVDADRNKAIFGSKFETKTYDGLYHFFKNFEDQNPKYLDEFLKAMRKHTKPVDNSIEEKTQYYFYRKIKEIEAKVEDA